MTSDENNPVECRRLAAEFERKAESAWFSTNQAFYRTLHKGYLALAKAYEDQAESQRAKDNFVNRDPRSDLESR
jgi:hypothetical protein